MSYFGFLAIFLGVPIVVLSVFAWLDRSRGAVRMKSLSGLSPWLLLGLLIVIAIVWTTPWDNYLVATRVWWYDINLVSGIVLGWVPLEEYCFFALQPIMTGLWIMFLMHRLPDPHRPFEPNPALRIGAVLACAILWIASAAALIGSYKPATYMALELVWALPPIAIQLGFGADILWHQRRIVATAILPTTIYLAGADCLAIAAGTWTIDPEQSFVILKIAGLLPIEEALFFLLTNTLVTFGLVLGVATVSKQRLPNRFRFGADDANIPPRLQNESA
jgi:lycopene cyclase domain-containing protein